MVQGQPAENINQPRHTGMPKHDNSCAALVFLISGFCFNIKMKNDARILGVGAQLWRRGGPPDGATHTNTLHIHAQKTNEKPCQKDILNNVSKTVLIPIQADF